MNSFGRVVALFLVVILICVFPLRSLAINQSEIMHNHVEHETKEFADEIMLRGYLTAEMYDGYLEKLAETNQMYDIEIIHAKPKESFNAASGNVGSFSNMDTTPLSNDTELALLSYDQSEENNRNPLRLSHSSEVFNANNPKDEVISSEGDIFSLAAHTHTDACYEGHRHLPVLGNPEVARNTKVFLQVGAGWFGNQYWRYVDIVCDEDNKPIYSIRMPSSFYSAGDVIGCTVLYTYDSNGNPTETRRDFTAKANSQGTGLNIEVYYYFLNILSWVSSNRYYRDGMNETSYTTTFSALPFGGSLPAWDPAGNRYSLPYQGCTYLNGHIDPAGCFPLGNMTQKVNVSMQYSTQPDLQHYYIAITDANAGREILVVSATVYTGGSHGGAGYGNSFNFNYTAFSPTGVLETTRYYAGSQDATMGFSLSPIMQQYFNYFKSLPNITVTTDVSNQYGYTYVANAYNVTWALNQLSYIKTAKTPDGFITGTTVWKGSPYQGGFGSTYSCGLPQDDTPDCNRVVTSITPTNPVQTVNKGENIITTATATYLDGHTGTVNCTSNFNTNLVGTQTVTLTYTGLVGNAKTTGTRNCTLNVTVKNNKIPSSLVVTPSSNTVYNGTEPTYVVTVFYEDGTSKVVNTGYSKTGFTMGAGIKTVTFSYTENDKTVTTSIIINVKRNLKTCVNGHTYELDDFDTDKGCPICRSTLAGIQVSPDEIIVSKGEELKLNVTAIFLDGHTETVLSGWQSNFDKNRVGEQLVIIDYNGKKANVKVTVTEEITCPICGTKYPLVNGIDPGCPICSKTVISIVATPDINHIPVGGDIHLDVTATYRDGHQGAVLNWTCDLNPFKVGQQTVTVYYDAASTTVTVFVESPAEITCPICGTTYNPILYPNGCPVCSNIIVTIEAGLRAGGTKVQYGSELNLYIVVIYKDNHRETVYNDWEAEGYQANKLGPQTINVTYKGFQTQLTIEVVNTLEKKVCPNGHVYYLNEDGSDPGCPYCNSDPTTESSLNYTECIYTPEILKKLYENGIYYLEFGDYITINVKTKATSIYDKLKHLPFNDVAEVKKYSYGGMVDYGERV